MYRYLKIRDTMSEMRVPEVIPSMPITSLGFPNLIKRKVSFGNVFTGNSAELKCICRSRTLKHFHCFQIFSNLFQLKIYEMNTTGSSLRAYSCSKEIPSNSGKTHKGLFKRETQLGVANDCGKSAEHTHQSYYSSYCNEP